MNNFWVKRKKDRSKINWSQGFVWANDQLSKSYLTPEQFDFDHYHFSGTAGPPSCRDTVDSDLEWASAKILKDFFIGGDVPLNPSFTWTIQNV